MPEDKTIYVILLNWNGWRDTVACLDTVFASQRVRLRAVVCDNASSDSSLARIAAWANGEQVVERPAHPRLGGLLGNVELPLQYLQLNRETAERSQAACDVPLVLIDNGANLGFAAGNNVGLRFALNQPDMDYVWILNNDTLVEPDCLLNMLNRIGHAPADAVCGSMIHFYDEPEVIQAIGGNRFNYITGRADCSEGRFMHEQDVENVDASEAVLDYLSGCSLLLPRTCLDRVGLMSEDYFLYYEEIDWFTRARGQCTLCVAHDARLYHREGAAIGSRAMLRPASTLSDFHMFRSRLAYMRKYHIYRLPLCYLDSWLEVGKRVIKGQFDNALTVASVLLGKRRFGS